MKSSLAGQCENARVLVINKNYASSAEVGHARGRRLVEGLQRDGFSVHLVRGRVPYLGVPDAGVIDGPPEDAACRVKIYAVGSPARRETQSGRVSGYFRFMVEASRLLRTIPTCSAVLVVSPPLPQVVVAMVFAFWHRAPLVVELTDIWPAAVIETGQLHGWFKRSMALVFEQIVYQAADYLVLTSPVFSRYLREQRVPPGKCCVAPITSTFANAYNDDARQTWRSRLGLRDEVMVLYAGSFNPAYGIGRLIAAASHTATEAPAVVWVFAGSGEDRGLVEEAARRSSNVHYLGALASAEVSSVFAAADFALVSLCPEHRLSHSVVPSKLIDYMCHGVPVLSLIDGVPGAIVRISSAGVVAPVTRPEQIADAVMRFARLPVEERRVHGIAAREWIARYWTETELLEPFIRAIAAACSAMRPSRSRWALRYLSAIPRAVIAWAQDKSRTAVVSHFGREKAPLDESLSAWLEARPAVPDTHGENPDDVAVSQTVHRA